MGYGLVAYDVLEQKALVEYGVKTEVYRERQLRRKRVGHVLQQHDSYIVFHDSKTSGLRRHVVRVPRIDRAEYLTAASASLFRSSSSPTR